LSPRDLLDVLGRLGICLRWEEGRLQFAAPKGVMTDELRAAIRGSRDELVALVAGEIKLCAICWRRVLAADVEQQGGIGTWWRCRDRESCTAAAW
jgi:hypothetical protein